MALRPGTGRTQSTGESATGDPPAWDLTGATMSEAEFRQIAGIVQGTLGIQMPPNKRQMLQSRLSRRLRALNLATFSQYAALLATPEGAEREIPSLLDLATTNKTSFFRESDHFDYLTQQLLPQWDKKRAPFSIWSAGCATGEEVFTMAMVLAEYFGSPTAPFNILGSDISSRALQQAASAIYPRELVDDIPEAFRRRYLMQSRDPSSGQVRFIPELRAHVSLVQLNLMDDSYQRVGKFAVIFFRNVMIYFDPPTRQHVISRLCECLEPGGHLFVGHSESLNGLQLPLRPAGRAVYRLI